MADSSVTGAEHSAGMGAPPGLTCNQSQFMSLQHRRAGLFLGSSWPQSPLGAGTCTWLKSKGNMGPHGLGEGLTAQGRRDVQRDGIRADFLFWNPQPCIHLAMGSVSAELRMEEDSSSCLDCTHRAAAFLPPSRKSRAGAGGIPLVVAPG